MKILIVTESRAVWGAEESLLLLLSVAKTSGVEPTVAVSTKSPLAPRLSEMDVPVIETRLADLPAMRNFGSWSSASKLSKLRTIINLAIAGVRHSFLVRKFDAALIFSVWQGPETILASKLARRPVLLDLHETFSTAAGTRLASTIARRCRGVLSPSNYLLARTGLEPSPAHAVIPRPIDLTTMSSPPPGRDCAGTVVVGMFGQIAEHKGVHHLIAAAESTTSDVEVLIVGGQAQADQRSAYENGIRSRVDGLPNARVIDRVDNPQDLMSTCHYVVNCSEHEAFGRGVLESTSAGAIPVVIRNSGPAEVVGLTGIGVVLDDADELIGWMATARIPDADACATFDPSQYETHTIAPRYWSAVEAICT